MDSLPTLLRNLHDDALIDYRSAATGEVRRGLFLIGVTVPIAAGVSAFVFLRDGLAPTSLFPAAAIFAGALMGTASMLFTRVKDLAAKPRPDVGRDPVYQASVVFRSALYCAEIALFLNAVLVAASIIPKGLVAQVLVAVAVALFVHMGLKVAMLLQGLRAQMFDTAGSRTQHPIAQRTKRAS
ncbi:hypothetical protein [Mycolicibacterium goodii]|uniref:Transmembrane protein n=1 Tax=Mycolicibacterium goodii TaxID=134601 RepID=A0ABS6HNA1_MYCGD|nr:hypothetical protein [Mycolicibacterium goodii]MBU8824177.1 hypothetical protein [Mycolicibacterium goodii]MBU8838039.1 hypothetical protein [Mycolicibacterium goodii]